MRFSVGVVASGYSAEALALFSRFTTPPTTSRKAAINNLIFRGKSFGWWQKLDVLMILAAADSQAATRNWIGDIYNATPTSSPSFEADHGYTGNGSSSYISTGFNPTTAVLPKFTQDSASMFLFSTTNLPNGASSSADLGGPNSRISRDVAVPGNSTGRANSGSTLGFSQSAYPGFNAWTRSAVSVWEAYNNIGADGGGGSTASAAPTNNEFLALRIPSIGFGVNQLAAYGWGSNLTAAEVEDLQAGLRDYMGTVGAMSRVIYLDGDSYSTTQGGVGLALSLTNTNSRACIIGGVGGDTLANEVARVLTASYFHKSVLIFWDGSSNGYGNLADDMALYAQVAAAVPKSIVIPPVRRGIDDSGTKAAITALQDAIATTYAGRTIDAQALLAAAATSPGDDADVAAGVVPSSLLIDPVNNAHLNSAGWAAIAPAVNTLLNSLGW